MLTVLTVLTDLCAQLHVHCQCKICQVEQEASQADDQILNKRTDV